MLRASDLNLNAKEDSLPRKTEKPSISKGNTCESTQLQQDRSVEKKVVKAKVVGKKSLDPRLSKGLSEELSGKENKISKRSSLAWNPEQYLRSPKQINFSTFFSKDAEVNSRMLNNADTNLKKGPRGSTKIERIGVKMQNYLQIDKYK